MTTAITVSHNGEPTELASTLSLAQAIEHWRYGDLKIAAAINGEFVPRSQYGQRQLAEGDQIDIVRPIGGG